MVGKLESGLGVRRNSILKGGGMAAAEPWAAVCVCVGEFSGRGRSLPWWLGDSDRSIPQLQYRSREFAKHRLIWSWRESGE